MLAVVMGGMSFLYYKGYRLNISSNSGIGPAINGQPDGLFYTVQVSVTPNESSAMNLVSELETDGYDAYYDTYESDRGHFYKVSVGQYADKQSADAVKVQVRDRYRQYRDSFVNLITEN